MIRYIASMIFRKYFVAGRVQGVYYRATAARHARELLITGYARNLPDGRVEVLAYGNEAAHEASVRALLDASRAGAPAEHAVDLAERVYAHVRGQRAPLGERTQRGADAARVGERGRRAGGLLLRTSADAARALSVENRRGLEPADELLEIPQHIHARAASHVIGVDEIEPESLAHEDERRRER